MRPGPPTCSPRRATRQSHDGDAGTCAAAVMAQASGENFPVASRFFPRDIRPHLLAVYGFARLVDDIGDEACGDRLAQLAAVSADLDAIYGGGAPSHVLLQRLAVTVRRFRLPRGPLDRLIDANVQDQTVLRYRTYDELLGYCRLSAQPVGELVLRVVEACTPDRLALSDRVCTALQLIEFLQDVGEDAALGRIYIPLEDLERFDCDEMDLLAGVYDTRFAGLMTFEAGRARALLESSRTLCRSLPGRVGLAVRMYAAGGFAALDDLERRRYATLASAAHPTKRRILLAGLRELARG